MLSVQRCLVSGCLALVLSAGPAMADERQDAIAKNCEDEPTPEARVACLEKQSRQRSEDTDSGFPAADDPLGPAGLSEPKTDGKVPTAEPAAPIAPPSLGPSMPGKPENTAGAGDASPSEAGGKSAADFEPGERYPAKVASVERVERGRLRLELANGEVWRQAETGDADLNAVLEDAEAFDAEIWRTPRGAFRMHIPAAGETIRIVRVE